MLFRLIFNFFLVFIAVFLIIFIRPSYGETNNLTIAFQRANLSDVIQVLAKFLHLNIIVSPTVEGTVTLHLQNAMPRHAFDLLLISHGLAKWQIGNVWYIAPRDELIKRKQEEMKWQDIWNESSPLVMKTWQLKYAKADEVARLLQDEHASLMSKRGRVRVDVRTNIICVQEMEEQIKNIYQLIKRLDVPVQQISIEARLVSIDNDSERELGIDFAIHAEEEAITNTPGRYSLSVAKLADGSLLDIKLAALENAGHAELISNPSLFTANQQSASIEAGEEVPYQEVSEGGGTAVTFKKAVLGLKVTPQVLPGNKVLLQLQINQDRPSNKMVQGVPTISTRQILTNVLVKNGQTIVLGGIYETNQELGEERVPFIAEVPVLGWLFKQQSRRENKRELLIFVTPKIIAQEA